MILSLWVVMCIHNNFQYYVFLKQVLIFLPFIILNVNIFPLIHELVFPSWCVLWWLTTVIVKTGARERTAHCNKKSYRPFAHFPSPTSPQWEACWLLPTSTPSLNHAGHRLIILAMMIKILPIYTPQSPSYDQCDFLKCIYHVIFRETMCSKIHGG